MKIAVVGAGAMGAMFGAKLARSGNEVYLVDVWKEHVDAMNRSGLLLKYKNDEGEYIPVKAVCSTKEIEGCAELVVIFVKGIYTASAMESAMNLVGPDTYVLTLQNGVGNADTIAQFVDPAKVIVGTTKDCATLLKPGVVNDTTEKAEITTQITSMTHDNNERVAQIADVLTKAGSGTEVSEATETAIWKKLVINCCANAPCMLTRLDMSTVSNSPYGDKLIDALIREVCAVAAKKGIDIDPGEKHDFYRDYYKNSTHHPSMTQDAYKKAKTEIETITGAVVREGNKYQVPVPVNETLYYLVKVLEDNYDKTWF